MTEQNVRDGDPSLELPDEEEIEKTTEETRAALEKLVQSKIAAAQPVRAADKQAPTQYIRLVLILQLPSSCVYMCVHACVCASSPSTQVHAGPTGSRIQFGCQAEDH